MTYATLVEATAALYARGFVENFSAAPNCLMCAGYNIELFPDDFEVVEVHRFEENTDPDDSAVVYAIESKDGLKGTLVMAYGAYAEGMDADIIRKLSSASSSQQE